MASAGPGTGSTWSATPSPTATAKTPTASTCGAIATTSCKSLNDDKPYDQFVREQLAGDEVAPGDPQALAATGFLRLWIYEHNQRDVRGQWDAIITDITNVTGDVFLGVGMGCARCHDHKFDPVLQEDYFRLRAFFEPILPRDDVPFATPDAIERYQAELAAWEAKTADIRAEIEALEHDAMAALAEDSITKFPPDIEVMINKPVAERLPHEHQLAELAWRQVERAQKDVAGKFKGQDKERRDELYAKLAAIPEAEAAAGCLFRQRRWAEAAPHAHSRRPRAATRAPRLPHGARQFARRDRPAAAGARLERPPHGAGRLDHAAGQPAHHAGDRQSHLAAALRPRAGRHAKRLRPPRRTAHASGVARLAHRRGSSTAAGSSSGCTS